MENSDRETLRQIFVAAWAKLVLLAIVLVPGVLANAYLPRQEKSAEPERLPQQRPIERPRPKELVKIFYIIQSNRPDMVEDEAWYLAEVILKESSRYKLDPILILAVIDIESKFQFQARSPAGARGIMQIMPETGRFLMRVAQGLGRELKSDTFTPAQLDNPVINIKLGTYYLHDLKKNFRDLSTALIAYNLGPTELRSRIENEIEYPDEYATAVLSAYRKYKQTKPPTF
jgi:soluble lytic murein transglycosylase-like protein